LHFRSRANQRVGIRIRVAHSSRWHGITVMRFYGAHHQASHFSICLGPLIGETNHVRYRDLCGRLGWGLHSEWQVAPWLHWASTFGAQVAVAVLDHQCSDGQPVPACAGSTGFGISCVLLKWWCQLLRGNSGLGRLNVRDSQVLKPMARNALKSVESRLQFICQINRS